MASASNRSATARAAAGEVLSVSCSIAGRAHSLLYYYEIQSREYAIETLQPSLEMTVSAIAKVAAG